MSNSKDVIYYLLINNKTNDNDSFLFFSYLKGAVHASGPHGSATAVGGKLHS